MTTPDHNRAGVVGTPARPPGRKAVGILLAPTTGRNAAYAIAGLPLALFLILGFITAGSSSSGDNGQSPNYGQVGQSAPDYPIESPTYPTDTAGSVYGATDSAASDYSSTDTATTAPSTTVTPTDSSSATASPTATGPAAVVIEAYADINRHDYQDAYNLGLAQNNESLQQFIAGYSTTASDALAVEGVNGDVVSITLVATSTGNIRVVYSGTYTVSGGLITSADLVQVN